MSWTNIHTRDYGWTGELILVQDKQIVDISSYTTLKFILRSPQGATTEKTAVFATNGTDGKLKRVFQQGDIPIHGNWEVQARISKTGVELTSDALKFTVLPRL